MKEVPSIPGDQSALAGRGEYSPESQILKGLNTI